MEAIVFDILQIFLTCRENVYEQLTIHCMGCSLYSFSGTIYEQKHMFLPLYDHTKLCHLELDFKCRVFQFGTWGISSDILQFQPGDIWSCEILKPVAHEDKKLDYDNNI